MAATTESASTFALPRWARWTLSAVILWHFTCFLSALIAPPLPGAAPSPLAAGFYSAIGRCYLQPLGLANAHRYYAPDVGPFCQAWFRVTHEDGSVRWIEIPGACDGLLPMRYQRRFGIGFALDGCVQLGRDGEFQLLPFGRVLLGSYTRHLASANSDRKVAEVQIYRVNHRMRLPDEAQQGWEPDDLRLFAPRYLGTWDANGAPKETSEAHGEPRCFDLSMSVFAATMLKEDILPHLGKPFPDLPGFPEPIRRMLKKFPTLLQASKDNDNLAGRIREAIEGKAGAAVENW